MMKYMRYALWGAVFIGAIALSGLMNGGGKTRASGPGFHYGSFVMTTHKGAAFTEKDLRGKPSVVFFGFTYCPNICPMTLGHITAMMKELGPEADRLNVVFVSIDPERDSAAHLATYLESFDSRIIGLTGTPEQVAKTAKSFNAFYKKVGEGEDYTMDHTASMLLFDAQGGFQGTIDFQENRAVGFDKVKMLLEQGG